MTPPSPCCDPAVALPSNILAAVPSPEPPLFPPLLTPAPSRTAGDSVRLSATGCPAQTRPSHLPEIHSPSPNLLVKSTNSGNPEGDRSRGHHVPGSYEQRLFSQMKLTPKRIVRFILGAILPVPLFVGIYYFSYFYTSYQGFDHESKTYLTSTNDLEIARQHLKTDAVVFLAMGYFLMGIPSLAYSFLLERHRSSSRFRLRSYVGWGALMGGISGLIAAGFHFILTDGAYDSLLVIVISCGIGGLIPLLLTLIRSQRPIQKDRENKSAHPTAGNVAV